MKWKVGVSGDSFDLEKLSESMSDESLKITEDEGKYYLESQAFEGLDSADEVREEAEEILSLVSGAARLRLSSRKPLETGAVIRINEDGTRHVSIHVEETMVMRDHVSLTVTDEEGEVTEIKPSDPVPDWVVVGLADVSVAKVLRLLGKGPPNWVMLYRIYEVIRADVGNEAAIEAQGWASENGLERFRRTANHPEAAGDEARHGHYSSYEPPSDPMTLSEARSFIEAMTHSWLNSKL